MLILYASRVNAVYNDQIPAKSSDHPHRSRTMTKKGFLGLFGSKRASGVDEDKIGLMGGYDHISSPISVGHPDHYKSKNPPPPVPSRATVSIHNAKPKRIVSTVEETLLGSAESLSDAVQTAGMGSGGLPTEDPVITDEIATSSPISSPNTSGVSYRRSLRQSLSPRTTSNTPAPSASATAIDNVTETDVRAVHNSAASETDRRSSALSEPPRMPPPQAPSRKSSTNSTKSRKRVTSYSSPTALLPPHDCARNSVHSVTDATDIHVTTSKIEVFEKGAKPHVVEVQSPPVKQNFVFETLDDVNLDNNDPRDSMVSPRQMITSEGDLSALPEVTDEEQSENDNDNEDVPTDKEELFDFQATETAVASPISPQAKDFFNFNDTTDATDATDAYSSPKAQSSPVDYSPSNVVSQSIPYPDDLLKDLPSATSTTSEVYRDAYNQLMDSYNSMMEKNRKLVDLLHQQLQEERDKNKNLMRICTDRKSTPISSPRNVRSKFIVPLKIDSPISDDDGLNFSPVEFTVKPSRESAREPVTVDHRHTAYFTAYSESQSVVDMEIKEREEMLEDDVTPIEANSTSLSIDQKTPQLASTLEIIGLQSALHPTDYDNDNDDDDEEVSSVDDIFDFDITAAVAFEESDSNMTTPESCPLEKF